MRQTELESTLSKLEKLLQGGFRTPDEIFEALKKVIDFEKAVIYFLTPEKLRPEYVFPKFSAEEIAISEQDKINLFNSKEEFQKSLFPNKNTLAERLSAQETPYGILILERKKTFSKDEKRLFKTCTLVVSNFIKELEITNIVKLQTQALQEGLLETDKAYKIIKNQNKKIIASDKIKTKFLSNVSHELRTPLNSILGFSELLQNPRLGELNEKQSEFVKDIQTAGIHLLGMINEILDISKIEAGAMNLNMRTFDIKLCVDETLNILKPLYEKKRIKIEQKINSTEITADFQKIQQILFNIINNAIKFTSENGEIVLNSEVKKKYITLSVKDSGCGIEEKYHKKIFQKFEQLQQTGNSTGLGLAITKELVSMHKGKVWVESEPEKGATFLIKLPIYSNNTVAQAPNICYNK